MKKYNGTYKRWVFKDSSYWKYLSFVYGLWTWATVQTWIQEGFFEPYTLLFGIPAAVMTYASYSHWKDMKAGRTR